MTISISDGIHTEDYAWPDDVSLLRGASFADLCIADFLAKHPDEAAVGEETP